MSLALAEPPVPQGAWPRHLPPNWRLQQSLLMRSVSAWSEQTCTVPSLAVDLGREIDRSLTVWHLDTTDLRQCPDVRSDPWISAGAEMLERVLAGDRAGEADDGDHQGCDRAQRGERPGSYGDRLVEAIREVHDDNLGEDRPEARI